MAHLLVALSAHGYGHGAQAAAVVNALRTGLPDLRVTLRTTLPDEFLRRRFDGPFTLVAEDTDVGMLMHSAVEIAHESSAQAYEAFHRNWEARVEREAKALAGLAPDLVLANVPYLPLAGAARAGITAVAMCSLNWADVYRHYFGDRPQAERILHEMRAAYRGARLFLRLEPGMPMPDLPNAVTIGPVATIGKTRRAQIIERLNLDARSRLVMIAPGGIELRLPVERWPAAGQLHWLVPQSWGVRRAGFSDMEALRLPFTDILCSCDALIGKPGYGTFAEAGCNAVPTLYLPRADWPESPYLVDWLERHGRARAIDRAALERGDVLEALRALWAQSAPPPPLPTGIAEAARRLGEMLDRDRGAASSIPAIRQ
jgi:hypothetical protein